MQFKEDIIQRIHKDFGQNAGIALQLILEAIGQVEYLKTDRVIRCIIYLAKGNISDLEKHIKAATLDPRDVMFWAEYERHQDSEPIRVRNLNVPFER